MSKLVDRVERVGAWAEVTLLPGTEAEARKRLTLKMKDTKVVLPQYRNHADPRRLYVPRGLVSSCGLPVDGDWDTLGVKSKLIEPRDGQQKTIDEFLTAVKTTHPYGGILQAVTGAGKTVMAIDIACTLNLKTLIIVPRSSLVDQWKKQILNWTDCEEEDIGLIQGQIRNYRDKRFTIAMIHTLAQQYKTYERDLFKAFGTVIFDECHVVGAETFSETAPLFISAYRIGLSATPRRFDGMDNVFYWHIGGIVAKFTKLQAKARVRIFPYRGNDTSHSGCVYGGDLNLGRYLNRIARSSSRLALVSKVTAALANKGHDILVLSDRIAHLNSIQMSLVKMGVDANEIGFLIGNRKELTKRIILGTYGSAGMGVDIPRLSALVLATPRSDIEQAVGRVLRQGSPIVVDFIDTASTIMQKWAGSRLKFFRKITDDIQRAA
jgi:superfamily II DNA or RNA helicase